MALLKATRFAEHFVKENGLGECDFKEWVLSSGMLFRASRIWWGDRGKRDSAHEGLDLGFYRDCRDKMYGLDDNTKIPVMYDGLVVCIVNDFLGESLIVKHSIPDNDIREFCTIYGHTDPESGMRTGSIVEQGEVIGSVASVNRSKSHSSPHVHISIGLPSRAISYDKLDWKAIGDPDTMTLIDPLQVIDRYCLVSDAAWFAHHNPSKEQQDV